MALCPFATHKLIPPGSLDPPITARIAILHVDAMNSESLYLFFRDRSGGIESHFFVKNTGEIEQYRDTAFQADANYEANNFAISIETQGYGSGTWNDAQLASIKRLLVWINEVHSVPLRKVDRWDGAGVGYHTQFGAPSHWTPVSKTCPGPDRIKQFNNVLVPWLNSGASLEDDEDMKLSDDLYPNSDERDLTVAQVLRRLDRYLTNTAARQAEVLEALGELDRAVDANADKDEVRAIVHRARDKVIKALTPDEPVEPSA